MRILLVRDNLCSDTLAKSVEYEASLTDSQMT